jgi:hypothetical protein
MCLHRLQGQNAAAPNSFRRGIYWAARASSTLPGADIDLYSAQMSVRLVEIIAAVIAGAVALLVLKMIGLIIKFAFLIALLITLCAWLVARAISAKFKSRGS